MSLRRPQETEAHPPLRRPCSFSLLVPLAHSPPTPGELASLGPQPQPAAHTDLRFKGLSGPGIQRTESPGNLQWPLGCADTNTSLCCPSSGIIAFPKPGNTWRRGRPGRQKTKGERQSPGPTSLLLLAHIYLCPLATPPACHLHLAPSQRVDDTPSSLEELSMATGTPRANPNAGKSTRLPSHCTLHPRHLWGPL